MSPPIRSLPRPWKALGVDLSQLTSGLALGAGPALILLLSLLVYLAPHNRAVFERSPPVRLDFAVVADPGADLTPAAARAMLAGRPLAREASSQRRETPFWMLVELPAGPGREDWLEWPSRHATALACWNADTLASLGRANNRGEEPTGSVRQMGPGFALDLGPVPGRRAGRVLCRQTFIGPARISAQLRSGADLYAVILELESHAGFMKGGLLMLALFALILALLAREARFVLLALWLVFGLRMGLMSIGMDTRWLGLIIPADWLPAMRKLSIALFYLTTFTLHVSLLPPDMRFMSPHRQLLALTRFTCLALLALALVLPYGQFLPFMWGLVGVGLLTMGTDLIWAIRRGGQRQILWYSTAILIVILAAAWEIVSAAMGWPTGPFDFGAAVMIGSCFVVGAFAVQLHEEMRERRAAQAELLRTYSNTPVGLFTLDQETGHFERFNRAMQQLWGDGARALAGTSWEDQFEPGAWSRLKAALARDRRADLYVAGRERGAERSYHVIATPVDGHIEGLAQDVTVRRRATERLRHLAEHDVLTGVYNRATFEQRLSECLHAVGRGEPASLMFVNLRRFRLINELYGLRAGDMVLKEVVARLNAHPAPGRLLGRVTGDCFGLLTPGQSAAEVHEAALAIARALSDEPYLLGEQAVRFKPGIGVIDLDRVMAYSDALALAEHAARAARDDAPVVVYDRNAPRLRDWVFQNELIRRLEKPDGFAGLYLLFQPIVALHQPSQAHNFEVLLRMRDADGQNVPIGQVLAAAEAGGLMSRVDLWVMDTTLTWLAAHPNSLGNTRFVCLNLSGTSLNDLNFADAASDCLRRHAGVAHYLCLEVTESVALQDYAHTRRFMERMKEYGVRFALDDFGAGYSSYAYLTELPVEVLKIDGSLVRDVARHPARAAIVGSIARMASDLGLRCIAEWVEDLPTMEALIEAGVDYVQGFGLVKPISPARLQEATSSTGLVEDAPMRQLLENLDAGIRPASGFGLGTDFTLY